MFDAYDMKMCKRRVIHPDDDDDVLELVIIKEVS